MRRLICLALLQLTVAGAAEGPANIRSIALAGFKRVPVAQLQADIPLRRGDVYDRDGVEAARRWLEARGLFIAVTTEVKQVGRAVDITFTVTENPLVQAVRIVGNTQLSAAALRPLLLTRPQRVLDRRALGVDAQVIGQAYLKSGLRVVVETAYDPAPTDPETPTTVTFNIIEQTLGQIRIEPLRYVKRAALEPVIILQPGELVVEDKLLEQQRRLIQTGLFEAVAPPVTSDPDETGRVDLLYRVAEHDQPVVTRALLPLVDLRELARRARFNAVKIQVDGRDLEVYRTPAEVTERLAAARQAVAARPTDGLARYDLFHWTLRAGGDWRPVAEQARQALTPPGDDPWRALRLGQVLEALGDRAGASEPLQRAAERPATALLALEQLVRLEASRWTEDRTASERLTDLIGRGAKLIAALPPTADLEQLTAGFQLSHTGLTLALMQLPVASELRLKGPANLRLLNGVVALAKTTEEPAVLRHLGRLLTAAGFAARVAGEAIAPPAVWAEYRELLGLAEGSLLQAGLTGCGDPAAWFFAALNSVLRDDLPAARATALLGLKALPDNARLVDVYVMTCVDNAYARVPADKSEDLLRASIKDIQGLVAEGHLLGWGPLMLLAKLNLALRDGLPETDPAGREQARQAAEAAARAATESLPERAEGWWILGLTQLKSSQPGRALASYEQVRRLQGSSREVDYAVALATLAGGDLETGLAAMERLAGRG